MSQSTRYQHLSIGQRESRLCKSCSDKITGKTPSPGRGIVDFSACILTIISIRSSRDQQPPCQIQGALRL